MVGTGRSRRRFVEKMGVTFSERLQEAILQSLLLIRMRYRWLPWLFRQGLVHFLWDKQAFWKASDLEPPMCATWRQ